MNPRYLLSCAGLSLLLSGAAIADCACTGAEVRYNTSTNSAVQSSQYCVTETSNFPECTEVAENPCGDDMKTYTCPIGGKIGFVEGAAGGHWFGVGLEYLFTGTDLNTCTYGLAVQRSIREDDAAPNENGMTGLGAPVGDVTLGILDATIRSGVDNVTPLAGTTEGSRAVFASDNYTTITNTQTIKISDDNTQIAFSDLPSVYLDDGDEAKKIQLTDVFLATVRNAAGDAAALCGCEFTITSTKAAGGTALTNVGINAGPGSHCSYIDVQ